MGYEELKRLFDLLSDENKFREILSQLSPEAEILYDNFAGDPISFYKSFLNKEEYRNKFFTLIINMLKEDANI